MLKLNMLVFFITALVIPLAQAKAPCHNSSESSSNTLILAWAHEQHGHNVYQPIQIFYGDFTGDGMDDALAWILYPSGGNSDFLDVALFRYENGQLSYYRSVDNVFGGNPRNVVITPGQITLTTTMHKPDEPRCCPTGERQWVIDTNKSN